jgi:hypothetical protein
MDITKKSVTNDLVKFIDNQMAPEENDSKIANLLDYVTDFPATPNMARNPVAPAAKTALSNPALQATRDANTQIMQDYGHLR